MSGTSARIINDAFLQKLESPEGTAKVAKAQESVIHDHLREVSVFRKLIPPVHVTRADCQISLNQDTLEKVIWLPPKSRAMAMAFDGSADVSIIRAPRTACGFYMISSQDHQKTTQNLMVYDIPITKMIEENIGNDMEEVEDRQQLLHAIAAVWAMQKEANGGSDVALSASALRGNSPPKERHVFKTDAAKASTADDSVRHPIRRADVNKLRRAVADRKLTLAQLVWPEPDWSDVLDWTLTESGDKIQSETMVDGYNYNTLLGIRQIRTIKVDIFRPGRVWGFPEQKFLGESYVLNEPQFYIDKVKNRITFSAWEDVGSILVNLAGIVCLESFSADANPMVDAQNLLGEFMPVAEEQLGAMNNRVEAGLRFPAITVY